MWKKIILCVVLIITGTAGAGFAQDQGDVNVEFEGRYWFMEMSANAQVSGETQRGTDIDLQGDLGLGDKDMPSGRFTWYTGPKSRLFFDYSEISFGAEKTLNKTIVFRDQTFDIGASVKTDLDLQFYKLGWIWQFIDFGEGTVKLGTLLDVRATTVDLSLESTIGGTTTRVEEKVLGPLATLGLALDINPSNWMNIFFKGSGLEVSELGYYIDTEAGIKLIPVRNLSIFGGYRYTSLEARDEGDNFDSKLNLKFKGPFAGVSLRF